MTLFMAFETTQCHDVCMSNFAIPSSCDPNLSFTVRTFDQREVEGETLTMELFGERVLRDRLVEQRQIPFPTLSAFCQTRTVLSYPIRDTNPHSNGIILWWKNNVPNSENPIQAPFPRLAEIGITVFEGFLGTLIVK